MYWFSQLLKQKPRQSPWEKLCEENPGLAKAIAVDVQEEVRDCAEDLALEQLENMSQEELDDYIDMSDEEESGVYLDDDGEEE